MRQLPVSSALIAFGTFKLLNQKTDGRSTALKTVLPQKDSSAALIQNPTQQVTHHLQAIICPGKEQVLHK